METGYIKYMVDEEYKLILRETEKKRNPSFRLLIRCIAELGLRQGDACKLKINNFSENFSILTYTQEKTKYVREIPIHKDLRRELKLFYILYHNKLENFIFKPVIQSSSKNHHYQQSTIRLFFMQLRNKYGLNNAYHTCKNGKKLYRLTPHTLKHYFTMKAHKACGGDITKGMQMTGHKTARHYLRYATVTTTNREKRETIEAMWG